MGERVQGREPDETRPPSAAISSSRRSRRTVPESRVSLLELCDDLRLLADPTRLRILDSLMEGIQCNCNIKKALGLPMNLISHHLKTLKEAGLVRAERDPHDARWIYYRIDHETLKTLRDSLYTALDSSRLKPRQDSCGPSACCEPPKRSAKPRAKSAGRSVK